MYKKEYCDLVCYKNLYIFFYILTKRKFGCAVLKFLGNLFKTLIFIKIRPKLYMSVNRSKHIFSKNKSWLCSSGWLLLTSDDNQTWQSSYFIFFLNWGQIRILTLYHSREPNLIFLSQLIRFRCCGGDDYPKSLLWALNSMGTLHLWTWWFSSSTSFA